MNLFPVSPNKGKLFVLIISFLMPLSLYAAETNDHVEFGVSLYKQGKFEQAIAHLSSLLYPNKLFFAEAQMRARKYLAFSYVYSGRRTEAEEEFRNLLTIFPSFELDEKFVSPKVIEIFQDIKVDFIDSTSIEMPDEILPLDSQESIPLVIKPTGIDSIRQIPKEDTLVSLSQEKKLSVGGLQRVLAISPGGAAQFYKNEPHKAWITLTAQVLGWGISIAAYLFRIELEEQEGGRNDNNISQLKQLQYVQLGFFTLGTLAYLYSFF